MKALKRAKVEGIELSKLTDDIVEIGTLTYFMAKSGAEFEESKFVYDLDGFLALITLDQLEDLTTAIAELFGTVVKKKPEPKKPKKTPKAEA
jgi:hypothetical protein